MSTPAGLLLCQLDDKAWSRFPDAVCRKLGREVILAVGRAARTPSAFANLRMPAIPEGLTLADLDLETRTRKSLTAAGFDRRPQDIGKTTAERMLGLRGFWVKSLVDLLTSLEYAAKHPKTQAEDLGPVERIRAPHRYPRAGRRLTPGKLNRMLISEAAVAGRLPGIRRIRFNDPRLGDMLRAMDAESDTVGEMVDRIRRRRLDLSDPLWLCKQLRAFRRQVRRIDRLSLEKELVEIFGAGGDSRDRRIVAKYFGWDGQGRRTLEVLGREYGLSRERIRQICSRAIKQHRNIEVFAPVLDRAIAFLAGRTPRNLTTLQAEFDKSRISACRLPIESVCRAARFLGRKLPFAIVAVDKGRLAVAAGHVRLARAIVRTAKRAAASYGAAAVAEVAAELSGRLPAKASRGLVHETLQTIAGFRWLDTRRRWFQLDSASPAFGLPNMIDKVLSVCPRIDVSRMYAALSRNRRSRRPLPPPKVLLEFCRHVPGVRAVGTVVAAKAPRNWRRTLAAGEQIMVRTLKRRGPVLERARLQDLCIGAGMNRSSFNAVLTSSPVIAQYGRGVYGLLGSNRNTVYSRRAK